MTLIDVAPEVVWGVSGLLIGAIAMRFLSFQDKAKLAELSTQLAVSEEKLKHLTQQDAEYKALQQLYLETKNAHIELKTRLHEQLKNADEKLALLKDSETRLSTQFENLASKIFEERNKQFTEHNKISLDHIVKPLREQLGEFKQRIETVYDNENKDRVSLTEQIKLLRTETAQMNKEALNLTRALKGDKKTQGNWGEMILESVLERSGLRKGIEYDTQGSFRDEDNRLFKPDVIVHLPEEKDIIIDSKVSLIAYEQYCVAENDIERSQYLKQHTDAVRNHIKGLSAKDYSALKGIRSLDFVLLFMPIEAAFIAAFQADERLFTDAFEHNIVVVTPTTLLATLRTIENIWRYERQNENAKLIADKAGVVYDKIRGFVEDLDKLGKQLSTVQGTYEGVMNKLTHGNGNLIRQANSFVELGIKVKKTLPKHINQQAGIEVETDENEIPNA
ncbi:MAG: DNA recombination protein RmuC [Methylococcales bacterium]|nr:DNA recombination protein RmuC [Methylococcales bacterium]